MGAFLHCDLGQRFTTIIRSPSLAAGGRGFDHLGFEVLDWDDLISATPSARGRSLGAQLGHRSAHVEGAARSLTTGEIQQVLRSSTGLSGDLVNEGYRGHSVEFSIPNADSVLAQWGPPVQS